MSKNSEATATPSVALGPLALALLGPFIGWIGAALLLTSFIKPTVQGVSLATVGNQLQCLGPMIGAPAFTLSAWKNKQPSWVLAGLAYAVCWFIMYFDGSNVLARASLIFMVGFAFSGLSNVVMPEATRRELALTPATLPQWIPFIVEDVRLTLRLGLQGSLAILQWPFNALKTKTWSLPECLSPDNLWQSRRLAALYFSVAGGCGIAACLLPSFKETGLTLFNVVGGMSAFMLNYSLFFTGLKGTHWMDKLLLPASIFATIGSSMRSEQWGFAVDQFGSRLADMYFNGLQFRLNTTCPTHNETSQHASNEENELVPTPA
jgi:hypothetical protein